jgi:hypothetical protein
MLAPLRTALTITPLHRATQRFVSVGGKSMIALVRGKISPPDKSSNDWFPPMAYSFADRVSPKVQNDWACAAILRRRNRSRSPAYASSAARSAAETVPSVG